MGMLVNGQWQMDDAYPRDAGGAFVRPASAFRHWITADGAPGPTGKGGFKAEPGRYHLYVAGVCPWAHRTRIVRRLKGLDGLIGLTVSSSARTDHGWSFDAQHKDDLFGSRYVHELYTRADPAYTGRVTVPVLWDKKTGTIVNNESADIVRMFNAAFDRLTGSRLDLYPAALRGEIDAVNERVYKGLNNGVYRAGNAKTQGAYEAAAREVFATLDWLEERLARRRYLVGPAPTEADWRLFPSLMRFDLAYHGVMKCNLRRLADYPALSAYARDLYQTPGIAETVDFAAIKEGYWGNRERNPSGIVPIGPVVDFTGPHGRERLKEAA
jgi:glutathionyl-hydroquinone reductase